MAQKNWKELFSARMKELVGRWVGANHIHSDEIGWDYYIPKQSLIENHPLLINHYRGSLMAVIPYKEYEQLENGTVDPVEYIDKAFWSYGYFWGGGSMLGGAFWQPLEEGTGIKNKEKIYRYLEILSCRTAHRSSGYSPKLETCIKCPVEKCPFSPHFDFSWENEVEEKDWREQLCVEMQNRIARLFNLKVTSFICYTPDEADGRENACLKDSWEEGEVTLYLPAKVFVDILCNPGERDWKALAEGFGFELISWTKEPLVLDERFQPAEYARVARELWKK